MIDAEMLQEYLNNHIAGSETALELLKHRLQEHPDPVLEGLRQQIEEDRAVAENLLKGFHLSGSAVKLAVGWIGEKVTRLKRDFDDVRNSALKDLLEYEMLQIGIYGKRSLWTVLQSMQTADERLEVLPLQDLIDRADAQIELIEARRIAAATDTLVTSDSQDRAR